MEATKVQINASLRFNPSGELVGRDLLLNFREDSVENAVLLLSDFSRRFNLNLGLSSPVTTEGQKPPTPNTEKTKSILPTQCDRCGAGLVQRTVKKLDSRHYGKSFLGCSNYRTGCLGVYWL